MTRGEGDGPVAGEYELKARLAAPVEELRERLEAEGWNAVFRGAMRDRRLDDADGSLESRDVVLRLRRYRTEEGGGRAVLSWKGPSREREGFKLREEVESDVADGDAVEALLSRLGYDRVTLTIERTVEILRKGGVTVRVERYPRMDVLVEIEGPPAEVRERIPETGIPGEDWKAWGLPRFLEAYEARTGETARLATPAPDSPGAGGTRDG